MCAKKELVCWTTLRSRKFHFCMTLSHGRFIQPKGISSVVCPLGQGNLICRTTLGSRVFHSTQDNHIHRTTLGSRVFHLSYAPWVKGISFVICRTVPVTRALHLSYNPCAKGILFVVRPLCHGVFISLLSRVVRQINPPYSGLSGPF